MGKERQKILIVEDIPANIEILSEVLGEEYEIIFATNGEDGLALASGERPDLILLDVMMPDMDGYEVCARLKTRPETKGIPIIFVTAMCQEEDETKGLELGAIDYINKPISPPVVRARVRNQLELKRYRDFLENLATAADRAKKEFLRSISHELRTPLTPILGMTDLVLTSEEDNEKREWLSCVRSSATKLLGIIEDLIETTRMEAEDVSADNRPFVLQSVLGPLVSELSPEAEAKGIKLTADVSPTVPAIIVADQTMLGKALCKLLENAIKFTPKGKVTLSVKKKGDGKSPMIRFSVSDTGIGVSTAELTKIFQDFTQADGTISRNFSGLGLGLTLARRLVALMGGEICAESIKGKGTVFHMDLPLLACPEKVSFDGKK